MRSRARFLTAVAALAILGACSDGGDDGADPVEQSTGADPTAPETLPPPSTVAPPSTSTGPSDPDGEADAAPSDTGPDTGPLADRLAAEVAAIGLVESGNAALETCPFGGGEARLRGLFDGLLPPSFEQAEVEFDQGASHLPVTDVALLGCYLTSPDVGYGLDLGTSPADFDAYQREFNDPDDQGEVSIDVVPSGEGLGGDFAQVCVGFDDDPAFDACEVSWRDGAVMLTAFVYGEGSRSVDLDALQARLADQTPDIVDAALR